MPESPGMPWLDDDYRCRYWTGPDHFLYSDELPGGQQCSVLVHCFPNAVGLLQAKHTAYVPAAWPGGNSILGPHEPEDDAEASSPGAESSSDSDCSSDTVPSPA